MADSTFFEINKHKNNISNLSNKFLNTFTIQEEIFLNNEIKKETEILVSLLNIKNNILNQNQQPNQNINNHFFMPMFNQNNINNINNNNNMNNNQFPQMPKQQIQNQIQQQMMMQQMQQQMMMQQIQQQMKQQLAQQVNMKNEFNDFIKNKINIQLQIQNEQKSNIIINKEEVIPKQLNNNDNLMKSQETNVYLNEITIIFKPIGDNGQPLEPVVVKCRPNDLVAYIIEQYRKKSGDKSRYKKFIFDDFNLFPGMTIANSGLYNNAEIYVYKNNE